MRHVKLYSLCLWRITVWLRLPFFEPCLAKFLWVRNSNLLSELTSNARLYPLFLCQLTLQAVVDLLGGSYGVYLRNSPYHSGSLRRPGFRLYSLWLWRITGVSFSLLNFLKGSYDEFRAVIGILNQDRLRRPNTWRYSLCELLALRLPLFKSSSRKLWLFEGVNSSFKSRLPKPSWAKLLRVKDSNWRFYPFRLWRITVWFCFPVFRIFLWEIMVSWG